MEIYPLVQLQMLAAALLSGWVLGALRELGAVLRVLLGIHDPPARMEARYRRPLPLLHRSVPFGRRGKWKRLRSGLLVGTGDFFYCLGVALTAVLLLYRFADGRFRLSVPLLLLSGIGLWRVVITPLAARVVSYLAYLLAALFLYLRALLLFPPRLVYRLVRDLVCRPLRAFFGKRKRAAALARSERLCREQLEAAILGWRGVSLKNRAERAAPEHQKKGKKGKHYVKKIGRKAVPHSDLDHSHSHSHHLLPFHRHHRKSVDGVRPKKPRKGSAGGAN